MTNTEVDAARYRWLRERFTQLIIRTALAGGNCRAVEEVRVNQALSACDPATCDRAIDEAMAATL